MIEFFGKKEMGKIAVAMTAGMLTFSSALLAADIDVYNTSKLLPYPPYEQTGDVAPPNPNYPNLMFVLDASLSMDVVDKGHTTTRLQRLQDAMKTVLNSAEQVNVGLMRFSNRNSGGRVIYPMSPIEYAREDAISLVDNMELEYWTPTVGAVLESAYYYGGHGVAYGKTRFSQVNKRHTGVHFSRVSHPDSYTGGEVIREAGCSDANLSDPSCGSERIDGDPVYRSPIQSECQQNFQVIISDGAATGTVNRNWVEGLAGTRCAWSQSNTCGVELAEFMATEDQSSEVPGVNTVKTYTVGFNSSLPSLEAMAEAGGGIYYQSSSADELAAVLTNVLGAASAPAVTFSPPTITIDPDTLNSNRNDVYLTLFEPSHTPLWSGNLKGYWFDGQLMDYSDPRKPAIDPATGLIVDNASSLWSETIDGGVLKVGGAAANITNWVERNVVTNHPDGPAELLVEGNRINIEQVSAADLGLPDRFLNLDVDDAQSLINWANGADELDVNDNKSTVDSRQQYGDPLHSNPLLVTYGKKSGDIFDSVVFFGTNEGFLHAVDTSTGEDLYSFMPWELIGNIKKGYVNVPFGEKLYGVDGYLSTWIHDANNNGLVDAGSDFAYLYTGMRRGGRSYYALDVTEKEEPKLQWTITGGEGEFSELGQTWSNMVYGRMMHPDTGVVTDVLVFGGGYDERQDTVSIRTNDQMGRAVYIVDALTGRLLWSASADESATVTLPKMTYSIPATPSVVDTDGDGLFDQVYVGDMGGQVWRFDFSANDNSSGGVIADFSDNSNPSRFFSTPDVSLIKAENSQPFLTIALGSGTRSQPLNSESNAFYVIKQTAWNEAPIGYGYEKTVNSYEPLSRNQLADLTANTIMEGSEDEAAQVEDDLAVKYGWFIEMESQGEKILNASITLNSQVAFTGYVPGQQSVCSGEVGSNNLYFLNLLDGTPAVDQNDDGVFDKADRIHALKATGISAPPKVVFTEQDEGRKTQVDIVIGQESSNVGTIDLSRRLYWSELPEF